MSGQSGQHIVTLEDALEELRYGRVTRVKQLPRRVYRQLVEKGLVMGMERSSDPVLLTGKGLARLREHRAGDLEQGRERLRESRNG